MTYKDWWKPSEIRYSREQIIWILKYLPELRCGDYPPEGKETGYIGGAKQRRHVAPFISACEIAGEVDARLKGLGKYQDIILALYVNNEEPLQVGRQWKLDEWDLSKLVNRMLKYLSGFRRKRVDFQTWRQAKRELVS